MSKIEFYIDCKKVNSEVEFVVKRLDEMRIEMKMHEFLNFDRVKAGIDNVQKFLRKIDTPIGRFFFQNKVCLWCIDKVCGLYLDIVMRKSFL